MSDRLHARWLPPLTPHLSPSTVDRPPPTAHRPPPGHARWPAWGGSSDGREGLAWGWSTENAHWPAGIRGVSHLFSLATASIGGDSSQGMCSMRGVVLIGPWSWLHTLRQIIRLESTVIRTRNTKYEIRNTMPVGTGHAIHSIYVHMAAHTGPTHAESLIQVSGRRRPDSPHHRSSPHAQAQFTCERRANLHRTLFRGARTFFYIIIRCHRRCRRAPPRPRTRAHSFLRPRPLAVPHVPARRCMSAASHARSWAPMRSRHVCTPARMSQNGDESCGTLRPR